jgi:hypothetical protein
MQRAGYEAYSFLGGFRALRRLAARMKEEPEGLGSGSRNGT